MNQHAAQPGDAGGIVVRNATVTYRNGHTALRDASFTAPGGSITALVGINGSGKSTLFKAIMGFVGLARGDITVFLVTVVALTVSNLGRPTRRARSGDS